MTGSIKLLEGVVDSRREVDARKPKLGRQQLPKKATRTSKCICHSFQLISGDDAENPTEAERLCRTPNAMVRVAGFWKLDSGSSQFASFW
jgi:hypothetical protein